MHTQESLSKCDHREPCVRVTQIIQSHSLTSWGARYNGLSRGSTPQAASCACERHTSNVNGDICLRRSLSYMPIFVFFDKKKRYYLLFFLPPCSLCKLLSTPVCIVSGRPDCLIYCELCWHYNVHTHYNVCACVRVCRDDVRFLQAVLPGHVLHQEVGCKVKQLLCPFLREVTRQTLRLNCRLSAATSSE